MLPNFLLPETTVREAGAGPAFGLDEAPRQTLTLTLGITRVIEQESLDVVIRGSQDGSSWSAEPLASFPQQFYCGATRIPLDLASQPEVRFLRAEWQVNRWGRGEPKPLFEFYVFAESQAAAAVGA